MVWIGRWQPGGHTVGLSESSVTAPSSLIAYAMDVCSGRRRTLASGPAAAVCAFSHSGRYAIVRVGSRGARRLLLVDTRTGRTTELLGADATIADARFAPDDQTIYLHTDADREFAALLALPRVAAGYPESAEVIAAREGAAASPTTAVHWCLPWNPAPSRRMSCATHSHPLNPFGWLRSRRRRGHRRHRSGRSCIGGGPGTASSSVDGSTGHRARSVRCPRWSGCTAVLRRRSVPRSTRSTLSTPVFVVHGSLDTNIPPGEAEHLVAALRERGSSPGYLLLPDEGHEILNSANRVVFVREVVQWLITHLLDVDERSA